VIFEDLECPDCARERPWWRRLADLQIPARAPRLPAPYASVGIRCGRAGPLFDTRARALGNEFRDTVYPPPAGNHERYVAAVCREVRPAHKIDLLL